MAYPVSVRIEPVLTDRNRLTTAFRCILAIPHVIVAGGVGQYGGLLGAAAGYLSIVSWFMILIGGTQNEGIRQFILFYLRWRVRVVAYYALLVDAYPPFGDAPYPASIEIVEPVGRDRLTVALRLLLVIPHALVLSCLMVAWWFVAIAMWFMILVTGTCPAGLAQFTVGVLRWGLRVEAYMLLLVDEYPPFSLED